MINILLEMPDDAVERLIAKWESGDPKTLELVKELGVVGIFWYVEPYYNPNTMVYSGLAI